MRNKLRSLAMMAVVFGLLEVSCWAQGCIMCSTALGSSPEGQALAGSFRYGIGVLLVAPYIILGSIGYAVYRAFRKKTTNRTLVG
jgi:hypothetical protein